MQIPCHETKIAMAKAVLRAGRSYQEAADVTGLPVDLVIKNWEDQKAARNAQVMRG